MRETCTSGCIYRGQPVSRTRELSVLVSGGVDSAVLVANQARDGRIVHPIYVRFGLSWEPTEEAHLRRFLGTLPPEFETRPLVVLGLPIADVYGAHWSVSGTDVPDETTSDAAVYLPGRNLLLLSKASVWCVLNGVEAIALGTLKGNPFADSSPDFFARFGALVECGLERRCRCWRRSRYDEVRGPRISAATSPCSTPSPALLRSTAAIVADATNVPNGETGFAGARMPDPTPYATA